MDYQKKINDLVKEIETQGYKAIVLWLPGNCSENLVIFLSEIAVFIKKLTDLPVYYVTYKNSNSLQKLITMGVSVILCHEEDSIFPIKEKSIVFMATAHPIFLTEMCLDNKLLFWNNEMAPCPWNHIFLMDEMQGYLNLCHEKYAMLQETWSSWDLMCLEYGNTYEPIYWPYILKSLSNNFGTSEFIRNNEINLAWIGKFEPDKIYSLYYTLDNFVRYDTDRRKVMHIIGEGSCRDEVIKVCKRYCQYVEFEFAGALMKEKLECYLIEKVDVLFGADSSILLGASLKIPTAATLVDTVPVRSDRFFWLFDSSKYFYSVLVPQEKRFGAEHSHFRDMMDDLFKYGFKREFGEKCYQYYQEYHFNIEKSIYLLLQAVVKSKLTMNDLKKCIKYVPYHHLRVIKRKFLGREISLKINFK